MTTSRFNFIRHFIVLSLSALSAVGLAAEETVTVDVTETELVTETEKDIYKAPIEGYAFGADVTAPVEIVVPAMPETSFSKSGLTANSVKNVLKDRSIYSLPYSPTLSVPDWRRLWINTGTLMFGGATALVVLKLLPQNATAWSRIAIKEVPMGQRWVNHVKEGPVWDHDKFIFNYILHPYAGAAYYMGARSCGFNVWGSFLYSFCISTIFWEYGVEAFMEVPSVQDIVITPVVGALFGEGFYKLKRMIVDRDYRVLGSKVIGHAAAFLLDPVNEAIGYIVPDKRLKAHLKGISYRPTPQGMEFGVAYNF